MKRELLEVTQADIEEAEQRRSTLSRLFPASTSGVTLTNCPVAVALTRQHSLHCTARVSPDCIIQASRWARPSERLKRFMSRWDRQWLASPARFLVVWEDL